METKHSLCLVKLLGLAILATSLSTSVASAQVACKGKFTLPFQVHWGEMILPAGQYTFVLDKGTLDGAVEIRRGESRVGKIFAHGFDYIKTGSSSLVVVGRGGIYRVRSLHLADLGLLYTYRAPKGQPPLMAATPQLIRRIPVEVSGK